jgi:hypothetical protein
MKVNDLKQSNYLAQKDFADGEMTLTIDRVQEEKVGQGENQETKFVLYFREVDKGLVLNLTNGESIAGITGSDDSDDWTGRKVVLYSDPSIQFAGRRVGGVRVRGLSQRERQPATKAAAAPGAPARPAPRRLIQPARLADEDGDLGPVKTSEEAVSRGTFESVEDENLPLDEKGPDPTPAAEEQIEPVDHDDPVPPPRVSRPGATMEGIRRRNTK